MIIITAITLLQPCKTQYSSQHTMTPPVLHIALCCHVMPPAASGAKPHALLMQCNLCRHIAATTCRDECTAAVTLIRTINNRHCQCTVRLQQPTLSHARKSRIVIYTEDSIALTARIATLTQFFLKPTQPYSSAHPPQALCPAALCILGVAAACAGLQCAPQLCKRC